MAGLFCAEVLKLSQILSLGICKNVRAVLKSVTKLQTFRKLTSCSPVSPPGNFFASQDLNCRRVTADTWSISVYGTRAFRIEYALGAPIPWTAPECSRAATVHIGGSLEEIVQSEGNFTSDRPSFS
jgi:hypothetical protein